MAQIGILNKLLISQNDLPDNAIKNATANKLNLELFESIMLAVFFLIQAPYLFEH